MFTKKKLGKHHKDSVTSINFIYEDDSKGPLQKLVTASMDGFIKTIDFKENIVKKAFFVSQSGINSATSLSS